MNKKLLLQISLVFLTLIFSIIFFNQTFKKENKVLVKNENQKQESENNLIEGIKYFSKDIKGNTYLIKSKNGTLDKVNPDIIYLIDVEAEINFDQNEKIEVTSKRAIYNVSNFDTKFSDNVRLIYDDSKITCRNITVKFSEDYAVLDGNLIYNNLLTRLYADRMEIDLKSRKTKTFMKNNKNKVTIVYKNYGIN